MAGLKDKIVVITGSSSGIGAATALEFAQYGVKLVLTGRDRNKLASVAEECISTGAAEVETVASDLSKEEGVKAVVKATIDKFGTIHVLVNNAGGGIASNLIYPDLRSSQGKPDSFDYAYSLMVRASWQLSGLFVNELIKNKGVIINNTSVLGIIIDPQSSAYSTMKAALNHMTKCMAAELGMNGVRVNAVLPGYTQTNLPVAYGLSPEEGIQMFKDNASKVHLLKQEILQPTDIAKAVVFLASDDAKRITGVLLPVDGGALLSTPLYDFASDATT